MHRLFKGKLFSTEILVSIPDKPEQLWLIKVLPFNLQALERQIHKVLALLSSQSLW